MSASPLNSRADTPAPSAAERHTFIGGSEAYELLNERQYGRGCVRALAYRKSQAKPDFDPQMGRQNLRGLLQRGSLLEDTVARLYMDETGRTLIKRERLVRAAGHPGAGVHTDRIILAGNVKPTGDAEIKTHGEGPFLNILRNGLPSGHNLQLQWSLFCTGHTWGAFIILGVFGEMPLKHFDIDRDEQVIDMFKAGVDDFWSTLGRGELPPPPFPATDQRCKVCPWRLTCRGEAMDPAELRRVMAEHDGKKPLTEVNNDELEQALADRALILSEMRALSDDSEEDPGALQLVTARVKELLGETERALVNNRWKVYCPQNFYHGLDTTRLRHDEPEIYKKYYVDRPTGSRRLTVYPVREMRAER